MNKLDILLAKDEIRDLQSRYMRGQDRLDADLQRSVFWPDATTDYGFFQGSGDAFVTFAQDLLRGHESNFHLICQSLIEVEGDVAFGEVHYFAYHRVVEEGAPRDLIIAGRYLDRYERRGDTWKISHRSELVDWARQDPAGDAALADLLAQARKGARGAADPSSQRDWLRTA